MKIDLNISSQLAVEIGLNESIILHKLVELLQTSGTEINGLRWIEQSYEEWQEVFPFWSISTIKRTISSLQKKGFIFVEQHGKHRYDRTNWYAVSDDADKQLLSSNDEVETENAVEKTNDHTDQEEIEQKTEAVQNHLKELRFFPLRTGQLDELAQVCRTHPLEDILAALEQTAARNIFAWKYAYKVLLSNVGKRAKLMAKKWRPRNIIRTEIVPEWLENNEQPAAVSPLNDEEFLEKKRRLEAIQLQYKQKESAKPLNHLTANMM